jgi:hypothetical protein
MNIMLYCLHGSVTQYLHEHWKLSDTTKLSVLHDHKLYDKIR